MYKPPEVHVVGANLLDQQRELANLIRSLFRYESLYQRLLLVESWLEKIAERGRSFSGTAASLSAKERFQFRISTLQRYYARLSIET